MFKMTKKGQNAIEYLLIFAAVISVALVALKPQGFLTKGVDQSLNCAVSGSECILAGTCKPCTFDDYCVPTRSCTPLDSGLIIDNGCENITCPVCILPVCTAADCGIITNVCGQSTTCSSSPVNGGWSSWADSGACTGCLQQEIQTCTNPSPSCGGDDCIGLSTRSIPCNSEAWTPATSICDASCGGTGTETTTYSCPSGCCALPAPPSSSTACSHPYSFYDYGLWGSCDPSCGLGTQTRTAISCPDPTGCCNSLQITQTQTCETNFCCGNGKIDGVGENCDGTTAVTCENLGFPDGGVLSCTASCTFDTSGCFSQLFCGNEAIDPGEQCDDGNTNYNDGCSDLCEIEICGDEIPQTFLGEQCDNGDLNNNNAACTTACKLAICGDTFIQSSNAEECDNGDLNNNNAACTTACKLAICGDTFIQPPNAEECDDGNTNNNDRCSSSCKIECGDGAIQLPFEQCDDANLNNNNAACTTACQSARCGDNYIQPPEQCDDGNTNNNDACTNACQSARCGDNYIQPPEQCDGANINSATCGGLGLGTGSVFCYAASCTFNTSGCCIPINGGWSGWSPSGSCKADCMQTQVRTCTNPSPNSCGAPCSPPTPTREISCSGGACVAVWTNLGDTQAFCWPRTCTVCTGGLPPSGACSAGDVCWILDPPRSAVYRCQ